MEGQCCWDATEDRTGAEAIEPPIQLFGDTMGCGTRAERTIVVDPQGYLQSREASTACWDDVASVKQLAIE